MKKSATSQPSPAPDLESVGVSFQVRLDTLAEVQRVAAAKQWPLSRALEAILHVGVTLQEAGHLESAARRALRDRIRDMRQWTDADWILSGYAVEMGSQNPRQCDQAMANLLSYYGFYHPLPPTN